METKIFLENSQRKKKAIGLIHRVYLSQLKNSRKYNAFTKTKSEVRGGGRKPWRQKGTGRPRAGSLRSPLFVGGGVIFGPKPRSVYKKVNKKEKRLAILSAFYLKKKQFLFLENQNFTEFNVIKTKKICEILETFQLNEQSKVLFLLPKPNKMFWLSSKNLKNIDVTTANCLNIKQLLKADHIILSTMSIELIHSTFGKQYE